MFIERLIDTHTRFVTVKTRSTAKRPAKADVVREAHAIADKQEAVLRARFIAAMKKLQDGVSINDIAVMMHTGIHRHIGAVLIPATRIRAALQGSANVVQDAVVRGGKLGAEKLNETLRRG